MEPVKETNGNGNGNGNGRTLVGKMRLTVHPSIALAIYIVIQCFIELGKEFNTVGAANLRHYDRWDWLILGVGLIATIGPVILAFLDPNYGNYRKQKKEDEEKNGKHHAEGI